MSTVPKHFAAVASAVCCLVSDEQRLRKDQRSRQGSAAPVGLLKQNLSSCESCPHDSRVTAGAALLVATSSLETVPHVNQAAAWLSTRLPAAAGFFFLLLLI